MELEHRKLLSTIVVNNPTDTPVANQIDVRQAIAQANSDGGGDTIVFSSLFNSPQTITLTKGALILTGKATTTITGPGYQNLTVSGGGNSGVFEVRGGSAALSGLTISGGHANTFGGGVYNWGGTVTLTDCYVVQSTCNQSGGGLANTIGGTLTLNHCTVAQNYVNPGGDMTSGCGGGIWNGGTATITDCSIVGNQGTSGAGLYNDRYGVLSLTSDNVNANHAEGGAGLYNYLGKTTLTDCTVSNNEADSVGGGGLYNSPGGTLSLTGCMVSNNTYDSDYQVDRIGGGGLCSLGTTTLIDCTVSSNTAYPIDSPDGPSSPAGGGLIVFGGDGTTTLTNCTFSANSGGGVYDRSGATLTNCTISGNTDFGLYIATGATATLTNTIVAAPPGFSAVVGSFSGGNNLIGGNSLLGPLGDYGGPTQTMPLLPGSPAIGTGTSTGAPTNDQRGFNRGSTVDIGAFQDQGFTLTLVAGSTPQTTVIGTAFANSLGVTVTANNTGEFVNPVDGGMITFTTPTSGASASLSSTTATITSGKAGVTATANGTPGRYTAFAAATGAGVVTFALTNNEGSSLGQPAPGDVVLEFDDLTSLRAAIAYANSHPGPDTIIFDPAHFGTKPETIRLVGGPLVLTNPATITIIGPGERLLTISGGGRSGVFDIEGGSLALSGLTIAGGRGGGLRNDGGALSLTDVVVRCNSPRGFGGSLFNDGTATLSHVIVEGNRARSGGHNRPRPTRT
jgi:parallel beta-helix repeat protein